MDFQGKMGKASRGLQYKLTHKNIDDAFDAVKRNAHQMLDNYDKKV